MGGVELKLYTIGFTKKSAKEFFETLKANEIKIVLDVRLNNRSQLAGFTKIPDFEYFLKMIGDTRYTHFTEGAPKEELLKQWQKKELTWENYEKEYNEMLNQRDIIDRIDKEKLDNACLLCSEPTPEQCHRRLLAEYFKRHIPDLVIIHL